MVAAYGLKPGILSQDTRLFEGLLEDAFEPGGAGSDDRNPGWGARCPLSENSYLTPKNEVQVACYLLVKKFCAVGVAGSIVRVQLGLRFIDALLENKTGGAGQRALIARKIHGQIVGIRKGKISLRCVSTCRRLFAFP